MKLCLHQPVFYFEKRLPAAGKLKVLSLKFIVYSKDLTTPQAQTEKLLVPMHRYESLLGWITEYMNCQRESPNTAPLFDITAVVICLSNNYVSYDIGIILQVQCFNRNFFLETLSKYLLRLGT